MKNATDQDTILEFKVIDKSNNWFKLHGYPMIRYLHQCSLHYDDKHGKKTSGHEKRKE